MAMQRCFLFIGLFLLHTIHAVAIPSLKDLALAVISQQLHLSKWRNIPESTIKDLIERSISHQHQLPPLTLLLSKTYALPIAVELKKAVDVSLPIDVNKQLYLKPNNQSASYIWIHNKQCQCEKIHCEHIYESGQGLLREEQSPIIALSLPEKKAAEHMLSRTFAVGRKDGTIQESSRIIGIPSHNYYHTSSSIDTIMHASPPAMIAVYDTEKKLHFFNRKNKQPLLTVHPINIIKQNVHKKDAVTVSTNILMLNTSQDPLLKSIGQLFNSSQRSPEQHKAICCFFLVKNALQLHQSVTDGTKQDAKQIKKIYTFWQHALSEVQPDFFIQTLDQTITHLYTAIKKIADHRSPQQPRRRLLKLKKDKKWRNSI